MILIILIISLILGFIYYFISNFIMLEDLVGEKKQSEMRLKDCINFIKNKMKKEQKKLTVTLIITSLIFISLYIKFGFGYEFYKFIFLFSILIISSIIDIEIRAVYLIISIIGIIGGLAFSTINILDGADVVTEIVSILIPILILGILKIASSKFDGLGGGDIEVFIIHVHSWNRSKSCFITYNRGNWSYN
ncbi:MAG: hypothetical protein ACRCTZ_04510 [Sarcina sp.]